MSAEPPEPISFLRPALRGSLGWETCRSDADGAFPVYALSAQPAPQPVALIPLIPTAGDIALAIADLSDACGDGPVRPALGMVCYELERLREALRAANRAALPEADDDKA